MDSLNISRQAMELQDCELLDTSLVHAKDKIKNKIEVKNGINMKAGARCSGIQTLSKTR